MGRCISSGHGSMPTISVVYGIVVVMYFADHEPPHVHVRYGEYVARVQIATGEIHGRLPARSRHPLKQVAPLP